MTIGCYVSLMPAAERATTTWLAFAILVVLGGGNGVAIRFSNRELSPFWGAGLRFAGAALFFFALVAVGHHELPRGRALAGAVLFGFLTFGASFALIYWALVTVQAGLAQVVLATIPLLVLLIAIGQRQERFKLNRLVGALLALGGIALIFAERISGRSAPALALLAILAAAVCIAEGTVVVKAFPRLPGPMMNAIAMTTGALFLFAVSQITHEHWRVPERGSTWAALIYLVALGSAAVFALYLFVLRRWPASMAAYQFVLIPVVTVLVSSWLDGETVTIALVAGGLLVLAGVYVGALAPAGRALVRST